MSQDPRQARFLRKLKQKSGQDYQQQHQQKGFQQDIQKAINNHAEKSITRDIQKQIQYFGHKIQPFNMRAQQQMGNIDDDGFFVFNRKRKINDAWLQSLNEDDNQQIIDKLKKKIKTQNRYQDVYQTEQKNIQGQSEQQEKSNQNQEQENNQQQIEQKQELNLKQIKSLIIECLPFGLSPNQYVKQLKKKKDEQNLQKILFLVNKYIQLTQDHLVMTKKRQDLQGQQQQQQQRQKQKQKPIKGWNDDLKQQKDQDDIF